MWWFFRLFPAAAFEPSLFIVGKGDILDATTGFTSFGQEGIDNDDGE